MLPSLCEYLSDIISNGFYIHLVIKKNVNVSTEVSFRKVEPILQKLPGEDSSDV